MFKRVMNMEVAKKEGLPEGARFYIKEFDVPLTQSPDGVWLNWFGGKPKKYDVSMLKPGNNWEAESFEQWLRILKDSM